MNCIASCYDANEFPLKGYKPRLLKGLYRDNTGLSFNISLKKLIMKKKIRVNFNTNDFTCMHNIPFV